MFFLSIFLPLVQFSLMIKAFTTANGIEMKFADKQVLIIEDQRPFLLLLKGLVNSMGATDVVTKSSAEQSLSLCKKQKFDIVVCDLHLGVDKKNGFELIEELRTRRLLKPTSIFIIISADSARPVVLGSIDRRPDDYLVKPFSQVQLKTRISRAWQKRQSLSAVYEAIAAQDTNTAIDECEILLSQETSYKGACEQLLVELYWEINAPQKAFDVLQAYRSGKPILWAQIALGKTYLKLEEHNKAIEMADLILKRNKFNADALDILANANDSQKQKDAAIDAIKQAIKISPFSLSRHFNACLIARRNDDYLLASESSKAIWELSKRTIHQDSLHWCGFIRSLLDVAEYSDDKKVKNRYQQEALLALQRGKFDEHLQRIDNSFDITIFSHIINARVNVLDGKMIDARRQLGISQLALEKNYDSPPKAFLPDSIKVMYDLGEYEDAMRYQTIIESEGISLDKNSEQLLLSESEKAKERLANYQKFNREGIQLYQQGQYEKSKNSFTLAQEFAPVNTGVALNLLQCLLQILSKSATPDNTLLRECRRLYKLLDDMPLKSQYSEKYSLLRRDLSVFTDV